MNGYLLMSVVFLREVVDEMNIISDEHSAYLNKRTGELITLSLEELSAAEEEDDLTGYPEWQRQMIEKAHEVLSSDDYLKLPSKFDIHEYRIMEEFCFSVENTQIRNQLLQQIKGGGAFRRFKNTIHTLGIEEDWYRFRDAEYERIAVEWLEAHGIEYRRDLTSRRTAHLTSGSS